MADYTTYEVCWMQNEFGNIFIPKTTLQSISTEEGLELVEYIAVKNLFDADITEEDLKDKQVFLYDSKNKKWTNDYISLTNIKEMSKMTPSDKQVIAYDGEKKEWSNRTFELNDLKDIKLVSLSTDKNQLLVYDFKTKEWINKNIDDVIKEYFENKETLDKLSTSEDGNLLFDNKEIAGVGKFSELEDVEIINPQHGDTLRFNFITKKWTNQELNSYFISEESLYFYDENVLINDDTLIINDNTSSIKEGVMILNGKKG